VVIFARNNSSRGRTGEKRKQKKKKEKKAQKNARRQNINRSRRVPQLHRGKMGPTMGKNACGKRVFFFFLKKRRKNGLSVSARIDAIDAISRDLDSSAAIGERNGPRENNKRVRVKRVKLAVVNDSHRRPHRVTTQFTYREKERKRERENARIHARLPKDRSACDRIFTTSHLARETPRLRSLHRC